MGFSQEPEVIRDRRGATRVNFKFPVSVRDASYIWKGEVQNLSSSGTLIKVPNKIAVGKTLQLEFRPEDMRPVALTATIRHSPKTGLLGLQFDLRATEAFERAVNLFEGLLALQPELAVEVRLRPTELAKDQKLYLVPNAANTPRPEESKILTYFVGGRSLGELERALGPNFPSLMYLPFSMLGRGLLSTVQPGRHSGEIELKKR